MQLIVKQKNGLGNQLFQYAAGRYYARRYGAEMRMAFAPEHHAVSNGYPRPFLLANLSIAAHVRKISLSERAMVSNQALIKLATGPFKRALGIQVFREQFEKRHNFMPDLPLRQNIRTLYLFGYWQTYRIVEQVADELRAEFGFRETAKGKTLEVLEQIRQTKNPVSLHVRRGDYALASAGDLAALPIAYYLRAIATFRERLAHPVFFVFSDDMPFVKATLPSGIQAVFVQHNDAFTSDEDLRLMSACHHHIISNSTFSWWGAWMNPRRDKMVIAPRQWHLKADSYYPDLLPPDWILFDVVL